MQKTAFSAQLAPGAFRSNQRQALNACVLTHGHREHRSLSADLALDAELLGEAGHLGIELGRREIVDRAPVLDNDIALRELARETEILLDEHDRQAAGLE